MTDETERSVSGWTVDTLNAHIWLMVNERDRRYEQRFEGQERKLETTYAAQQLAFDERDRRYEQRFEAQQHALRIALEAVNREFHEHLLQVERETKAALDAAEKAIGKSESAYEKRFESVNEFRSTLSDQAKELMPRMENEQRLAAITGQLSDLTDRYNRFEGRLIQEDRQHTSNLGIPAVIFGAIGALLGIVGFVYGLVK